MQESGFFSFCRTVFSKHSFLRPYFFFFLLISNIEMEIHYGLLCFCHNRSGKFSFFKILCINICFTVLIYSKERAVQFLR